MEGPGCRRSEFSRWTRVMLEHEREFLSKTMASAGAFLDDESRDGFMHDLLDIDVCLGTLPEEAPRA